MPPWMKRFQRPVTALASVSWASSEISLADGSNTNSMNAEPPIRVIAVPTWMIRERTSKANMIGPIGCEVRSEFDLRSELSCEQFHGPLPAEQPHCANMPVPHNTLIDRPAMLTLLVRSSFLT